MVSETIEDAENYFDPPDDFSVNSFENGVEEEDQDNLILPRHSIRLERVNSSAVPKKGQVL